MDFVVQWPGGVGVVLGGDVEGEVEEGLAVGFDEGGESALDVNLVPQTVIDKIQIS